MAKIDIHIKRCHEQVLKDIETTKAEGEVAPNGVNVVEYYVGGEEDFRFYSRLVATKPIFQGRNGKKTKIQHLGEPGGLKAISARDAVRRRKKIKALEKLSVLMEKTLHELRMI